MANYKKSEEMRKSILQASEHLVRKNGYTKISIKDISDYLEIPRSLIYYYFKNKEDIMHALYYEWFNKTEELVETVLPRGKEPLVRLMLKYMLYRQMIIYDPLYNEYVVTAPEYAARGETDIKKQIMLYFGDSRDAFAYYGKPADGKEFYIHILMVESIARGLIIGTFHGLFKLTDREYLTLFGERAIMPTFGLTKEQFEQILDRAFELEKQIKDKENF